MKKSGRTLVLAFDGTSNEFTDANTNVAKLCAVLQNDDERQMVYYQPGIGTYTDPGIRGSIQKWFAKVADLAVAWYLDAHVMGGYEFLMNNHLPGDSVVMFGFSRGAYTARALAGMLYSVGLLPKGNREQIPFAYRIYKDQHALARPFKETFCKSVEIKMLGVWDTVASVGVIIPRTLPFVSNDTIRVFRHAISLDEHRTTFNVTLWNPENEVTGRDEDQGSRDDPEPCVREMWFVGVHTDVGGSAELDTAPASLANIPFRWMLHEIQRANCGILFDNDGLDRLKVPIDCVVRFPRPTLASTRDGPDGTTVGGDDSSNHSKFSEPIIGWEEADNADITADTHDQLKMRPWWWLLQIPTWTGKRFDFTGIRQFPVDKERQACDHLHPTVIKRIQSVKGYRPRADLPQNWKALVAGEP